jgi:hypothetical protein
MASLKEARTRGFVSLTFARFTFVASLGCAPTQNGQFGDLPSLKAG